MAINRLKRAPVLFFALFLWVGFAPTLKAGTTGKISGTSGIRRLRNRCSA